MSGMKSCVGIEKFGFAVVPELFRRDELDTLLEQICDLAPERSRAGIRHAMRLAPVKSFARHPQLMELACGVLGPQSFPYRATLFEKSEAANWLVVWHQDTALPLQSRREVQGWGPWSIKDGIPYAHAPASVLRQVLALRVSLDDSTVDNGPLRVLPHTHNMGVLSDDSMHDLASRVSAVDCITSRGGVVAMRPLLVHASSKARVEMTRRVLHIEYAASDSIAEPLRIAIA
jgi:ectoine hydroxylase-related dioxygenase (phytanoyl-CoA dioxygenase family)